MIVRIRLSDFGPIFLALSPRCTQLQVLNATTGEQLTDEGSDWSASHSCKQMVDSGVGNVLAGRQLERIGV